MLAVCLGCDWHLKPEDSDEFKVAIERYDRIQSLYLTTGDYSALQQLNTRYPMQTRALIEDVLRIGKVNDPAINTKFQRFYQDTVLQRLINEVEQQYANVDDLNKELTKAFRKLKAELPDMEIPMIYTQIGALDQSIVVGNNTVGICLDKYLGQDYPLYLKYYPQVQRKQMVRAMIVPDCLVFYLLSLYPIPHDMEQSQHQCDLHLGKIFWVVNKLTSAKTLSNGYVSEVNSYMKKNKHVTIRQLLEDADCKLGLGENAK